MFQVDHALEPLDCVAALPTGAVIRAEELHVERERRSEPLRQRSRAADRAVSVTAAIEAEPGRERLVVPADKLHELGIVDEALEEPRGLRTVVSWAAHTRTPLRRAELERVVNEGREAQPPSLLVVRGLALDVGENVGDVVLDGPLGVTPAGRAPLDAREPLGVGGDLPLHVSLDLEGQ